jgi:IS5 family transposase
MAAEIAGQGRVTLGADKGYDQKELVRALREYRVSPHVAQKVNSAIDRRSTRDPGYLLSQR